ncbi:uncharacterized protein LOC129585723 [Paramacrobiotus metropolitanus]|uniref:uncharacterized protein LOC129585723 n=1 Tax=Paramacrobiotus metropolitanus TaxID=2943436 RepID=UPI002446596A|nr:uncharacterized protein LOC129585723 [Paramacrobiotus metropolitanus]
MSLAQQEYIHTITRTVPHVPHRLDSSRIRNVLREMVTRLHIACLLPRILSTSSERLHFLEEHVCRLLALIKLQLHLIFHVPVPPETGCCLHRTDSRQYILCDTRDGHDGSGFVSLRQPSSTESLSVDVALDDNINSVECLSTDQGGLLALEETFSSLCRCFLVADKLEGQGRLLQQTEAVCRELQDENLKLFLFLGKLHQFSEEILLNVAKQSKRTPYEHSVLRRKSAAVENLELNKLQECQEMRQNFLNELRKNKRLVDGLYRNIQIHQTKMFSCLSQVRKKRTEVGKLISSRAEDDSDRHKRK